MEVLESEKLKVAPKSKLAARSLSTSTAQKAREKHPGDEFDGASFKNRATSTQN